ncbi:MAG TPA: CSLREA domain-containing protein [Thermoanaerobaculia bacterium]|nr:CSLREA domain-containing protein [Thermoanaerobaculia bacterium]
MGRLLRISVQIAIAAAIAAIPTAAYANTITVNSTADVVANDGQCTFREAIIAANTNTASGGTAGECAAGAAGLDTIAFNIAGAGVHTIAPSGTALPTLTEPVTIDGYTQPGASPNTAAFPAALNTVLLVELNLAGVGELSFDAPGSTVRGLVLNRGVDNILVNANNTTIRGNFIGTDPTGTIARPNIVGGFSIRINGSRTGTTIGGPNPADRNLLSGDTQGAFIELGATGTLIQGNFIGSDKTGTIALTVNGIGIDNASDMMILNNLVSGNGQGGIDISTGSGNVVVQGNLIGTQANGTGPLPNGNFGGIYITSGNNTIGGTGAGQPNTIAFNNGFGVIPNGGTDNFISGNSIYGNTFLGISYGIKATAFPNDNCDLDTGPNNLQNSPVITSAVIAGGNVTISGTLNSTASADFRLEFFSNTACDPSGNGQGQTFLGSANVTTPVGNCNVSFGPVTFPVPPGQTIFTATATELPFNTSEFSACFPLGVVLTPTPTPTGTVTASPTPTNTPVGAATPTPTPAVTQPGAVVPTLSPGMLLLLGAILASVALLLIRRSG